jgi:serine/threonine protein kinase
LTELRTLRKCQSPEIVECYGVFLDDGEVSICMEFMDVGSLDRLYRESSGFNEAILGKITLAVLKGLLYLYDHHKMIHRGLIFSYI